MITFTTVYWYVNSPWFDEGWIIYTVYLHIVDICKCMIMYQCHTQGLCLLWSCVYLLPQVICIQGQESDIIYHGWTTSLTGMSLTRTLTHLFHITLHDSIEDRAISNPNWIFCVILFFEYWKKVNLKIH